MIPATISTTSAPPIRLSPNLVRLDQKCAGHAASLPKVKPGFAAFRPPSVEMMPPMLADKKFHTAEPEAANAPLSGRRMHGRPGHSY